MVSALRTLFMFRKRCGDDALKIAVINMWSMNNGEGNTHRMKPDTNNWYFDSALNMGATITRYDKESTCSILHMLLNCHPVTIQELNDFIIERRARHGDLIPIFHSGHGGEAGVPMGWKAGVAGKCRDNLVRLPNLYNRVHAIDQVYAQIVILDRCHFDPGSLESTRIARTLAYGTPSHLDLEIWRRAQCQESAAIALGFLQRIPSGYFTG